MDFSRLSRGELVAGICGALLFIFLWLPWYAVKVTGGFGGGGTRLTVERPSVDAWQAFGAIDIILFLVAAVAVALVLLRASDSMPPAIRAPELLVAAAGGLAFVLVLYRLIDSPLDVQHFPLLEVSISRKVGIFLGLLASAGVAVGGWLAMNERRQQYVPPIR